MRKSALIIGVFFTIIGLSQRQNLIHISFEAEWEGKKLEDKLQFFGKDSIQITEFRFYVSNFVFERDGTGFLEQDSYHLIDLFVKTNFEVQFPPNFPFDTLEFYLGIDSLTNVDGVIGGDMDPTLGMYWTWQSGYINLKLEGKSIQSPKPKHDFQFHLGGYLPPFLAAQKIRLPANSNQIRIGFDLKKFFEKLDIQKTPTIMSPGKESVNLSKHAAECFYIK
ncbi:MAG: MbnP family protein [Crocinitomicaceae bacterium]